MRSPAQRRAQRKSTSPSITVRPIGARRARAAMRWRSWPDSNRKTPMRSHDPVGAVLPGRVVPREVERQWEERHGRQHFEERGVLGIEPAVAEAEVGIAGRDVRGLIGRQRVLPHGAEQQEEPSPPAGGQPPATRGRVGGDPSAHVCSWHQ